MGGDGFDGSFIEVGTTLAEIRDSKLYREQYTTFNAYCKERWGWGRAHAYRMIQSAKIGKRLSPMGDRPERRPSWPRRAGLRRASVSELENGQTTGVEFETLEKLARALRVDPGLLIVRASPHS